MRMYVCVCVCGIRIRRSECTRLTGSIIREQCLEDMGDTSVLTLDLMRGRGHATFDASPVHSCVPSMLPLFCGGRTFVAVQTTPPQIFLQTEFPSELRSSLLCLRPSSVGRSLLGSLLTHLGHQPLDQSQPERGGKELKRPRVMVRALWLITSVPALLYPGASLSNIPLLTSTIVIVHAECGLPPVM